MINLILLFFIIQNLKNYDPTYLKKFVCVRVQNLFLESEVFHIAMLLTCFSMLIRLTIFWVSSIALFYYSFSILVLRVNGRPITPFNRKLTHRDGGTTSKCKLML